MNTLDDDLQDPLFDLDDYEFLQNDAEMAGEIPDGGDVSDIFSGALTSAPRIDMYRHWVYEDMYPDEPLARLENWSDDDLEHYT